MFEKNTRSRFSIWHARSCRHAIKTITDYLSLSYGRHATCASKAPGIVNSYYQLPASPCQALDRPQLEERRRPSTEPLYGLLCKCFPICVTWSGGESFYSPWTGWQSDKVSSKKYMGGIKEVGWIDFSKHQSEQSLTLYLLMTKHQTQISLTLLTNAEVRHLCHIILCTLHLCQGKKRPTNPLQPHPAVKTQPKNLFLGNNNWQLTISMPNLFLSWFQNWSLSCQTQTGTDLISCSWICYVNVNTFRHTRVGSGRSKQMIILAVETMWAWCHQIQWQPPNINSSDTDVQEPRLLQTLGPPKGIRLVVWKGMKIHRKQLLPRGKTKSHLQNPIMIQHIIGQDISLFLPKV
jgi:hypothetical protein